MAVKVRKVGNSFSVTIPAHIIRQLHLRHGQELDEHTSAYGWEYRPARPRPAEIRWEAYESPQADIRDGLSPDAYIRKLREQDRDETLF